jgi:hypothetical protein
VHVGAFVIKCVAVLPNFADVSMKICWSFVYAIVKIILDCAKVHWFFYYIVVVSDAVSFLIYRSQERERTFVIF